MNFATGARIEHQFNNALRLALSGPMTAAQAVYQFQPRMAPVPKTFKRQYTPGVEDQGQQGKCVGESGATTMGSIYARANPPIKFADELFYNLAKWLGNLRGQGDTGANVHDGLDAARIYGLCKREDFPDSTDPASYDSAPPDAVMALAAQYKLGRFERIDFPVQDWQGLKAVLNSAHAEGLHVIAAIKVPRWLFYIKGAKETHYDQIGALGMQPGMQDQMGFHALIVEDNDDTFSGAGGGNQMLLSSWTEDWADKGRFACPNLTFTNQLVMELWAVRSFAGVEVAPAPEAPLSPAELDADRKALQAKGLGVALPLGFDLAHPASANLNQFMAALVMRKRGRSNAQIAAVLGIGTASVDAFLSNPDHQALLAAWSDL
ncbi:MAG: peptidase [Polaromonas sp.]|nr:peptidase [Polaromonas sp.]